MMGSMVGNPQKNMFTAKARNALVNSQILYLITKNISFGNSVEYYLPRLVEILTFVLETERCAIYLYDKESDEIYCKVITGKLSDPITYKRSEAGALGESFSTGLPVIIKSAYDDERFNPEIDRKLKTITKNILIVPINFSNHSIGCIELCNKKGDFLQTDIDLV
jgi:transcriptional regulator with GAF, ATPase, and Fis domain